MNHIATQGFALPLLLTLPPRLERPHLGRLRHWALGLALCLGLGLGLATHAAEMEVAGVKLEDKLLRHGTELQLNGAGVRTRFFFKVYVAALYVPQKTTSEASILESNAPRSMQLHMLRELEASTLSTALEEGLRHNHTATELEQLKPPTMQLTDIMLRLGKARPGDVVTLDFSESGVEVSLNGEARGQVVSPNFAKALLKVWLGEKPVDEALKKALIAG